jgi:hypothetical protein
MSMTRTFGGEKSLALRFRAYASSADWHRGTAALPAEASLYICTLEMAHAVRRPEGIVIDHGSIEFLIDSSDDGYPLDAPRVRVLSSPCPVSPHIHPGSGFVCLGTTVTVFRSLAASAIATIALINMDLTRMRLLGRLPVDDLGAHFDPAALEYWKARGGRPVSDLRYPDELIVAGGGTSRFGVIRRA